MISKRLMFFAILFVSLLAISGVSASEINDDISINDDTVTIDAGEIDNGNLESADLQLDDNSNVDEVNDNDENLKLSSNSDILTEDNPDGTFTDLANEIENANGELNLTRNYVYNNKDIKYKRGININKSIIINGNGFTINGKNLTSIFNITSDNSVINNIYFINSRGNFSAIYWSGVNGSVSNCSFINNSANGNGGAVYWSGVNGSVSNCSFVNNSVDLFIYGPNGEDYSYYEGGAVYWSGVNGSVSNCSFVNNSADFGAAISWVSDGSIFNCSFVNNLAQFSGGAIYCLNASSIFNCIFERNNAAKYGGAIYCLNVGPIFNCSFNINNANYHGGTIYCLNVGSIFNCSINYVYWEDVDAIYWGGGSGSIFNCTFLNRHSHTADDPYEHFDIYWDGGSGSIFNCTFNRTSSFSNYSKFIKINQTKLNYNLDVIFSDMDYLENQEILFNFNSGLRNNLTVSIYYLTNNTLYKTFQIPVNKPNYKLALEDLIPGSYKLIVTGSSDNLFKSINSVEIFEIYEYSDILIDNNEDLTVKDELIVNVTLNDDANGTIMLTINNETYEGIVVDGKVTITVPKIIGGSYNYTVYYSGDSKYHSMQLTKSITVQFGESFINFHVDDVDFNQSTMINPITPENATGTIGILVDGVLMNNFSVGEIFELSGLTGGEHNITLIYYGDNYYSSCENTSTVLVNKIDPEIVLSVPDLKAIDILVNITIYQASGDISINIDNKSYTGKWINGSYIIIIPNLKAGKYNYTINFSGDQNYNAKIENYSMEVQFRDSEITFINGINIAGESEFSIILFDQATGNITISINNKNYTKPLSYGNVTFYIFDLPIGDYNYTIFYSGDEIFNPCSFEGNLSIQGKTCFINLSSYDIYVDEIANITYNIDYGVTGILSVYLNDIFVKDINIGDLIEFEDLVEGNYTVKVIYNGDGYYASSEGTTTFEVNKLTPTIQLIVTNLTAGDNADIIFQFDEDVTGNVIVNGSILEIINGRAILNVQNIKGGTHRYNLRYEGDRKYKSYSSNYNITVSFKEISIDFTLNDINWGDVLTLNPSVKNMHEGLLDIYVDGKHNSTIEIGSSIDIPFFVGGSHNIKVSYNGDAYYAANSTTKNFNVIKLNSTCYMDDTIEARNSSVKIYFSDDATGNVVIKLNNSQISSQVIDGVCTFSAYNFKAGVYKVNIAYKGDSKYNPSSFNKTLNILYKKPTIDFNVSNVLYGENIVLNPKIDSNASGSLKIYLDNILNKTISIGSSYTLIKPNVGFHEVKICYDGDNYFESSEKIADFWVLTRNPIECEDSFIIKNSGNHFNATFYDEFGNFLVNKYVFFRVNGENYTAFTNSKGVAILENDFDLGNYSVVAINPFVNEQKNTTLIVFTSIQANDMSVIYGNNINFSAKFFDATANVLSGKSAIFRVNGEDYPVLTDSEGNANINICLNSGTYEIISINIFTDENKTNKLIVNPTILSNDKNVNYNSNYFQATFLDKNGDLLVNQEIIFKLGSQEYNRTTNSDGVAILDIVLSPGNYNITSINLVTGETKENRFIVNKLSTNISSSAVSVVYNTGKYLIVTLKDSKGNILSNKKVTIKVGTISKTLTTNAKGQVSVLVSSLVPKTYTASISFAGDTIYLKSSTTAKVVVKKATPKLTAKAKSFKRSVRTKKYTITLKNNKGVVMKNTKVTLTVNKKTYSVKTNSKGMATFKITNLKKKGKFTAVVKYAGSKYYNKVTKKPRITIKA